MASWKGWFEGNVIAAKADWPDVAATYTVLDTRRAQIYGEHEYVVTDGSLRFHPTIELGLGELAVELFKTLVGVTNQPLDERLRLAVFALTHAPDQRQSWQLSVGYSFCCRVPCNCSYLRLASVVPAARRFTKICATGSHRLFTFQRASRPGDRQQAELVPNNLGEACNQ